MRRGGRHRRARGSCAARTSCSPACPPAAGASSRQDTARWRRAPTARRGPAGPGRDGVRRRGRERQARSRGLPAGARLLGAEPGRASCSRTHRRESRPRAPRAWRSIGITTTHERAALTDASAVIDDLTRLRRRPRGSRAGCSRRARRAAPVDCDPAWTLPSRSGRGWASASPAGSRRSRCSCRCSGLASTRAHSGPSGLPALVLAAVDLWLPQIVRIADAHRGGRRGMRVLAARRPRLGGPRHRRRGRRRDGGRGRPAGRGRRACGLTVPPRR